PRPPRRPCRRSQGALAPHAPLPAASWSRNLESSAWGAGAASALPAHANRRAPNTRLARTCALDLAPTGAARRRILPGICRRIPTMRIVAGRLRGARLAAPPPGDLALRPTGDRVRESLFNLLAHRSEGNLIAGARV